MDDTQMDAADFGFVVVDQSDHLAAIQRINDDFVFQLASHAFFVAMCLGRVICGNMPAYADARLGVQLAFALTFAASVLEKERLAGGVAMAKNHIRNKL